MKDEHVNDAAQGVVARTRAQGAVEDMPQDVAQD